MAVYKLLFISMLLTIHITDIFGHFRIGKRAAFHGRVRQRSTLQEEMSEVLEQLESSELCQKLVRKSNNLVPNAHFQNLPGLLKRPKSGVLLERAKKICEVLLANQQIDDEIVKMNDDNADADEFEDLFYLRK